MPAFRGVPLTAVDPSHTQLVNMDIRKDRTDLLEPGTDHFNIEKKAKVHAEVLRQVLAVCPGRMEWAKAHGEAMENAIVSKNTPTTRPVHAGVQ